MVEKYNPAEVEAKWQKSWNESGLYKVDEGSMLPKWYALTMFPYTSGDLHIGHWYAMAPSDVYARFKRMQGYNVLHPIGFDAFGFPAENAAIKKGVHPKAWTLDNIENMRKQLKSMGAIYDWDREVVTCQPEYYKWTQWFFLKMWEAGLAYRAKAPVNWCPSCQAVLANEQVVDGGCWRCETQVTKRDLEQWFFRITKYADELMQHEGLDWPERIKTMQTNWVGRSEGAEIAFAIDYEGVEEKEIRVFTTRPDTVYGVSCLVLAPEHPLVQKLTTVGQKAEVEAYIEKARQTNEIERLSTDRPKDGVFTGAYATNRFNNERIPIWIADYVLLSYGSGAVMAVPAHDERDFVFAHTYKLPIKIVIFPKGWDGKPLKEAYVDDGVLIESNPFSGTENVKAKGVIADYAAKNKWGNRKISYKLRDWLVSRQRYWGAPIPIVYCDKCGIVPVPEKDLPVLLPDNVQFSPIGESPLATCHEFVKTTCPVCGAQAKRETDTMDTFMCSSWYFLRYTSPKCQTNAFDHEMIKKWMPVDIYTGGAEHAVMHLFYARFFTKALRDMGIIDFGEPFIRLFNQGTVTRDHQKMSKSKGNVVNPDKYVSELGADTIRAYLMFLGPWEQGGDWDDSGIHGISRWLGRMWNLALDEYVQTDFATEKTAVRELLRVQHQTIRRVTEDIDRLRFNTMVSALMEYSNYLGKIREAGSVPVEYFKSAVRTMLLLVAPTAPHFAEEVWSRLGYPYSVHSEHWQEYDQTLAANEEVPLVVQVNGQVREKLMISVGLGEEEVKRLVLGSAKIQEYISGKEIVRTVYVPDKLINLVAM